MPTFPGEDLPSVPLEVTPSAQLSPNATPAAFGASVGQGIESIGDATEQLYRDRARRANQVATIAGYNQLTEWENQNLHNPKQGILNQNLGDKATPAVEGLMTDYNQLVSKISAGMANDQQRIAFGRMAGHHGSEIQRTLYQYEAQQGRHYADQQTGALIENSQQAAANNAIQPDGKLDAQRVQDELDKQRAAIVDAGERNGSPPELVNMLMQRSASATHGAVLSQLLSAEKDQDAKAYFDAHKQDLLPQAQEQFGKAVEIASVRGQASRLMSGIVLTKDGQVDSRLNVQQRILDNKEVQADPRLAEEVQRHADVILAQHDEAVRQDQNQAYDTAYRQLRDSGYDMGSVDAALLPKMRAEQVQALDSLSLKKIRGQPVRDDATTWLQLNNLFSDPTKKGAAQQVHLEDYADRLSIESIKAFATKQDAARNGNDDMLTRNAELTDVAKNALLLVGRDPEVKAGQNLGAAQDNAQFIRAFHDAVQQNEDQTKKPLNRDQLQKVADDLLLQRPTGTKGFFGGDITAPTYKIPGAVQAPARLGAGVSATDASGWTQTLANPHSADFDFNIQRLQRWSHGIDDAGEPNPELAKRAATIMESAIGPAQRLAIVNAYSSVNRGQAPTESQVLAMWASHQKRMTPVTAQPTAPAARVAPPSDNDGWSTLLETTR